MYFSQWHLYRVLLSPQDPHLPADVNSNWQQSQHLQQPVVQQPPKWFGQHVDSAQ
jgi:hypothetical protein